MTIKKFIGKTKEEAIAKAKEEFGEGTVVMNVKEVKPNGLLRIFKKTTYEVTAAIEVREKYNGINLSADEKIVLPPLQTASKVETEVEKNAKSEEIEKKLENLSNMIEKKLQEDETKDKKEKNTAEKQNQNMENFQFMKMLYRTLIDNEVNEKYVNLILEEAEKIANTSNSVDVILSNVYQKMILKFGQPNCINTIGKKPKIIFFIGPTGVGKTTTIAKIASKYRVEHEKKVAFLTADTYRIAATEQLHVYANILSAPMHIVYSADELNKAIENVSDQDLVFVDTAGFSHRNETQRADTKNLIEGLSDEYEKEVFLVLSATTKYKDLQEIIDAYREIADYKLIFTKLDETSSYGNLLNIKLYSGADLSYVANGQNVPDDIEVFNSQAIVKQLLGGK